MTWEGWTVDDVMELGPRLPGYPRDRVEALWGGRERLSIVEVCDLDIPAMDRSESESAAAAMKSAWAAAAARSAGTAARVAVWAAWTVWWAAREAEEERQIEDFQRLV